MKIETTTTHRLTRYERVLKLMNQAIEDRLTDKMMQAVHLLRMMSNAQEKRMYLRAEKIKQTR